MALDANGQELKVGDKVLIEAVVQRVAPGDKFENIAVVTTRTIPPFVIGTSISLNSSQVEKK